MALHTTLAIRPEYLLAQYLAPVTASPARKENPGNKSQL